MIPLAPLPRPEERRELRDQMGICLEDAAREVGVSSRQYLRWEWGDSSPRPGNHRKYSAQLQRWQRLIGEL